MTNVATLYPETPIVPVANTFGGVTYDDPYQWLESDTPDVVAWQATQDALAQRIVRGWSGFEPTLRALWRLTEGGSVFLPVRFGGRWFRQARIKGLDEPVLQVSASLDDAPRTLIDPNAFGDDGRVILDWWAPSKDGRFVACSISRSGDERGSLRIVNADDGTVLPDRLPQVLTTGGSAAWLPDATGLFFPALLADTSRYVVRVYFHRLGEPAPSAPEPIPEVPYPYMAAQVSEDGRWAAALTGSFATRPYFVRDLSTDDPWRPFLQNVEGAYAGHFSGDRYIALTADGASRGRVVSIPIATAEDRSTWTEVIPESDHVLRGLDLDGDKLIVTSLVDVETRIRVFDLEGRHLEDVPLPGPGTAMGRTHDGELTFTHQSYTRSNSVYRYELGSGRLDELTPPANAREDRTVRLAHARSADGASVSFHVVHRNDVELDEPRPTIVYAYGGWNSPLLPTFVPGMAAFVDAGGVLVQAHLRGGGEYGRDWWDDGRLTNKHHTFEDLIAVVEAIIGEGWATPERLGFLGASNGGMLAGAIANLRPDLFRAIVASVPIFDLLRLATTPMSLAIALSDYGNPSDPAIAPTIASYSPYHNVRESADYPAMLLTCGESDPRCPVWHGRKMAARLQAATTSGLPILLRVWPATGHVRSSGRVIVEQTAEWLAFVLREFEMEPPEPR